MRVTVGIPTYNRSKWLAEAIRSVLAQSHQDFVLIISDNASSDDTPEVVASFDEPRIQYSRLTRNIGSTGNMNRIFELVRTEYVVILPDDDLFYPDYLISTLRVLNSNTKIGVVHTSFDLIDQDGQVLRRAQRLLRDTAPSGVEPGSDIIERGMRSSGLACFSSCLFRTDAVTAAGCLRVEDEPLNDLPLMMRIGLRWDIGWLAAPLVALRLHDRSVSSAVSTFQDDAFEPADELPEMLFRQRMRFVDEARLPAQRTRSLQALAKATYRRESIGRLTLQIGTRRGRTQTLAHLFRIARLDPGVLAVPGVLKLIAALIVGRPVSTPRPRLSRRT